MSLVDHHRRIYAARRTGRIEKGNDCVTLMLFADPPDLTRVCIYGAAV